MKVIVLFVFVLGALSAAGEVFFANVGDKVTLNCGVNSYIRSLKWYNRYDFLHSVDQRGFPRKGTAELAQRSVVRQTNLEISSVRETDAGEFECSADWTPRYHSLVVFSVSVSVTPSAVLKLCDEATLHCEVKHLLKGCEVKWKSPNADSPEWPSTVQLKSVTSSHNGTWECIITCDGKQLKPPTSTTPPSTRKNITLFVTSVQKTTCTTCTTCTADDCPLGLSCWMWIAMGVCCQFGMFLIVCVTVLCKCMSRRMVCEERRSSSIYV
ncbi:CD4-2 molecule, tandem duplicate 2 isoform X2 [Simochromis diagramma]|uniref:CD4-2 molecule, tandem duplicate 2 isoform X2 n=1 Tax=Simochromis diagramma TaxID=43689 RepID=UPI001A7E4383|nr:CD4-2 molecule, tandem duplicate 2 isoform X2 [Simochromis diagramma]